MRGMLCIAGFGAVSHTSLHMEKLIGSVVCVVAEKRVMGAPYSGTVDRMRSLFKQQLAVVADYIRFPSCDVKAEFPGICVTSCNFSIEI